MKSAIVGCGGIAYVHARSLQQLQESNVRLAAVADCVPEKATQMGEIFQVKSYTSLEEMIDAEEIDVLHICTPHFLHTPMAEKALKRGISVFMEKPPVISWQQWEQLRQAACEAEGKARLGFCFQNRYNASVRYVKELVERGTYGKVCGIRGIVTWKRDRDYYENSDWRGKLETEGGGVLINQSIHTMDLIQYLCGQKPLRIRAVVDNQHLPETIEVEDTMAAYIEYPAVRACFYASNSYASNAPAMIELECEGARMRIEDMTVTIWDQDGKMQQHEFPVQPQYGKDYWGGGHQLCIKDFYHCLKTGEKFSMEWDRMEDTVWLMLKAYESARGRK